MILKILLCREMEKDFRTNNNKCAVFALSTYWSLVVLVVLNYCNDVTFLSKGIKTLLCQSGQWSLTKHHWNKPRWGCSILSRCQWSQRSLRTLSFRFSKTWRNWTWNSEFEFGRWSLRVKISLVIEILLLIIMDTITLECIRHITSWTRSREELIVRIKAEARATIAEKQLRLIQNLVFISQGRQTKLSKGSHSLYYANRLSKDYETQLKTGKLVYPGNWSQHKSGQRRLPTTS